MQEILLTAYMLVCLVIVVIDIVVLCRGFGMYIVKFRGQGVIKNMRARSLPQAERLLAIGYELQVVVFILSLLLGYFLTHLH